MIHLTAAEPEDHHPAAWTIADASPANLLAACNRTERPYPSESTIAQLFEAIAAESPSAPALAFGSEIISYSELNTRANCLANRLLRLGVGPEVMAAVSIDRSSEMIVAILGIAKAGGAYLPLDADAPPARLQVILESSRAPIIVAQSHRARRLAGSGAFILNIDTDWADIATESGENPLCEATARSLAYVMFTSGSTGPPKGVMVEHRAIVRLVRDTDYVNLDQDEVLLQMAPLAFDASTFEIWGALLNGAKLAIMPAQTPTATEIGRAIARFGITTVWLTAGLFHLVVESGLESLRGLRQLLAGGDVLSVPHARTVVAELRDCRLINGYGPTECTTFSCCFTVNALTAGAPSVPIGRPIANTRAYILDANGAPVGIGEQGELYIGGDGVARGYLNSPDKTAEKFRADPFSAAQDARMYRTGDLARYLPDGNIEFIGRSDNQVKIRGFRIELDEIAAALLEHPAIGQCAVLAHGNAPDNKRLAAYLTIRGDRGVTSNDLREFMKLRLPEYMTPALFLVVPAMPLTENGKIDRALLAESCGERLASGILYAAPTNDMEQIVAEIWQEVLGLDKVGLNENFFDIGGDSLRITQMHWKLQQGAGQPFAITALFQHPTVKTFAAYLVELRTAPEAEHKSRHATGASTVDDRAARQRAALGRWKPVRAKGGEVHG